VGSEALVQGSRSRGLTTIQRTDGEFPRTSVHFADTGSQLLIRSGRLQGLIHNRDQNVFARVSSVDELGATLIAEVNRIHAEGQGLSGLQSVVSLRDVLATDAALNDPATGLDLLPTSGSFFITTADDATATPVAYQIQVDLNGDGADTTLESLVADINATVQGVIASITSDRRLALTASQGFSFTLGHDGSVAREDTSGVLGALGANAFFSGRDARDIAVSQTLIEDPNLIAAATENLPGDGSNALRIASLAIEANATLNGASLADFHLAQVSSVASTSAAALGNLDAADSVASALTAQRESISGVNLDEEAIALIKFQRAFQGASRFVSVVDRLVGELVSLIR
jgi:flagellar hook-associated protein 1 FlgK